MFRNRAYSAVTAVLLLLLLLGPLDTDAVTHKESLTTVAKKDKTNCSTIREKKQCTPKECIWCQNKYVAGVQDCLNTCEPFHHTSHDHGIDLPVGFTRGRNSIPADSALTEGTSSTAVCCAIQGCTCVHCMASQCTSLYNITLLLLLLPHAFLALLQVLSHSRK